MRITKLKNQAVFWITAVLMFILLSPYFVWQFVGILNYIAILPLYLILVLHIDRQAKLVFPVFFGVIAVIAAICNMENIISIIVKFLLALIFIVDKTFLYQVFGKFKSIYVILISLSILVLLLVRIGVELPSEYLTPVNELKTQNFRVYPFLVTSPYSLRFNGLFDEPGVVGVVSFSLLFIGKLDFKRFDNIIVLISGILSLSLFFYLALAIAIVMRFFKSGQKVRSRVTLLLVLFAGLFFVLNNKNTNELIIERTRWDAAERTITGDDRALGDLKDYVKSLRGTDAYYWGIKNKAIIESYSRSASIQNAILKYGIVVVVLFFVFYFAYSLHTLHSYYNCMMFMILLFCLIYNRPTMFDLSRLFLYNMVLYSLIDTGEQYGDQNKFSHNMVR